MNASRRGTPSHAERARTYIRDAIIDGTLAADTMLSEVELAAQLGVSRTPIRTALVRLQDEGWVRIYPKRGALVTSLTPDEIVDLTDARLVLETSGVARASSGARIRLAEELLPSITQQRDAFAAGDIDRFIELTLDFHNAFLAIGGNRYLIDLGDRLSDRRRQLLFGRRDALQDRSGHIIDEHETLVACLRDDDPARFATALRAHVSDTLDL